jgi:hypothetical protein
LALAALLASLSSLPIAAAEPRAPKGPVWTREDSLEAVRIVDVLARNPGSIDSLTAGSLTRDHSLGFGRRMREAWVNPAGKLGFALKIYYEGTHPAGFEVRPVMNYAGLRARYLAVLTPLFRIHRGADFHADPYHWNLAIAARPIPADSLGFAGTDSLPPQSVREALAYYMTPYSGILYGIRGGDADQIFENRDRFIGLNDILMADKRLARYLLRSVNPATRLTAAEFIIRHKESFPDFDSLQATVFRIVFANPPKAATMRGGLEASEDPRRLVEECARREARRDGRGVLRMY